MLHSRSQKHFSMAGGMQLMAQASQDEAGGGGGAHQGE